MAQTGQVSSKCCVEVSGWDATECFFVERSFSYCNAAGQEVPLRARLREGAVVFVRLLQPFEIQERFPVPHRVAKTLPVKIDGRTMVVIERLHPKPSHTQSSGQRNFRVNCA